MSRGCPRRDSGGRRGRIFFVKQVCFVRWLCVFELRPVAPSGAAARPSIAARTAAGLFFVFVYAEGPKVPQTLMAQEQALLARLLPGT